MGLSRYRVGELVLQYKEECGVSNLRADQVSGINADKEFFEPAKQVGQDTSKYRVVPCGYYACNLMHVGRDVVLPIALNRTARNKIVSPAYSVFQLVADEIAHPEYLYMLFNSTERDRYFWFHTDGSVRDGMSWDDFCACEIELPPIEVQRKYVAIYEAMLTNQRAYERGLDDLKTICFSTIERFRREMQLKPIGNYIGSFNEKNSDGAITLEQGVNIQKQFIAPQRPNSNLLGRKIVRHGQFAYCTQLNNANVAIAIREGCDCVVSSVYDVFEITKTDELLADYLMLWLIRPEFGRYVYWASVGSAYEFLSFDNLASYKIPVPTIAEQKSVADIYRAYKKRRAINERLKSRLKDICPILIRGSIGEASR